MLPKKGVIKMKKIEMSINAIEVFAELHSAKIKLAEKSLEKSIREATNNGLTVFFISDGCYDKYTERVLKEWGYKYEIVGSNTLKVAMVEPEDYDEAARHSWYMSTAAYATAYRKRIEIIRFIEGKIKEALEKGYEQMTFECSTAASEWVSEILEENKFKTEYKNPIHGNGKLIISW